jgi:hypothetical protein
MRALLSTLALCLFLGCGKDEPDTPTDDLPAQGSALCGTVEGIHQRDVNGAQMGNTDPDDWNWAESWCPAEEYPFQGRPAVTWSTSAPDSLMIVCYPNPASDQFMLRFFRDDPSYVDIRFVDDAFQYLWGIDSLTSTACLVDIDSLGTTNPGTVRVLYRVVHSDGSAHRGHGDVQLDP